MKKTLSKFLSAFLAVILLLGMMPLNAFAATDGDTFYDSGSRLYYMIISETDKQVAVTVHPTGYPGTDYTVPSTVTYDGATYTVTEIGEEAFYNNEIIESVSIPNTVTRIGPYAFSGCTGLTSLTVPASVVYIDSGAFVYCLWLDLTVLYDTKKIIESDAFELSWTSGSRPKNVKHVLAMPESVTCEVIFGNVYNCSITNDIDLATDYRVHFYANGQFVGDYVIAKNTGGTLTSFNAADTLEALGPGKYTVRVQADTTTSGIGESDWREANNTFTYGSDSTAPTVTGITATRDSATKATVTFTSSEKGTFYCDGTATNIKAGENSIEISVSGDAAQNKSFHVTDYSGNQSTNYTANIPKLDYYTVAFDVNGHGTAIANQSIAKGGKAMEPVAPTADGYTFGGWYKDEGCTVGNEFRFLFTAITANMTLYAKWTANAPTTYTVTYNANGGTGTVTDGTEYTPGQNATVLDGSGLTHGGDYATFGGWNTKEDGSGTAYNSGDSITVTENITLYAQWFEFCAKISRGSSNHTTFVNGTESTIDFRHNPGTSLSPKEYTLSAVSDKDIDKAEYFIKSFAADEPLYKSPDDIPANTPWIDITDSIKDGVAATITQDGCYTICLRVTSGGVTKVVSSPFIMAYETTKTTTINKYYHTGSGDLVLQYDMGDLMIATVMYKIGGVYESLPSDSYSFDDEQDTITFKSSYLDTLAVGSVNEYRVRYQFMGHNVSILTKTIVHLTVTDKNYA